MILGAGCAGLSLAWYLLEMGVTDPLLVVDQRSRFDNDRTWCFWDVEPTPFSDLATHSWSRWRVDDGEQETVAHCPQYPYLRIRSVDFYRRVLDRLAQAPNVTLSLGQPILGVRETSGGLRVTTPTEEFDGIRAFDSRPQKPATSRESTARSPVSLLQHFFGQTIVVDRPTFDPGCPTLMDFRTSQSDGPHFFYVLPFSTTEALVENTYLFDFKISKQRHTQEIADYVQSRYGLKQCSYIVKEEESGAIPMNMSAGSRSLSPKLTSIGLAGGAARPSSGYAFLRIQRQTQCIAQGVASLGSVDTAKARSSLGSLKYLALDTVFLRCLADRPELAPQIFGQMFAHADDASVVRFLCERSTILDDLRIVAALPKTPFVSAAARTCLDWVTKRVRG